MNKDEHEIEVDLDDETIVQLALYAHKLDITINQAVNRLLAEMIQSYESDKK